MWKQKLSTWLMLVLTLISVIAQPVSAVETSKNDNRQSDNLTRNTQTTNTPTINSTEESTSSTKKENETKPERTKEPKEEPTNTIQDFLQTNQLVQGSDGKLYTTGISNYVQVSIQNFLQDNRLLRATNQVVTVPTNVHISNIDIHLSNGNREYGWYGKRVNGEVALCIEQGVAVNVGDNGGYTSIQQDTALLKKISLIKYYGLDVPGYSLHRELMTQLLAWEQQGITPTSISGEFNMADYQSFKSSVMANVNKFYVTPSFDGQTITLKVGESKTLNDSTNAFNNYENTPISNTANVSVTKNGSSVTITAKKDSNVSGIVNFRYNIPISYQGTPIVFDHPYTQNVMTGRVRDPAVTLFKVIVQKNGNARVRKVDALTKQPLAGAVFRFTTSDGQTKEITTGSDGYASWDDLLVDTKVTIQEIKAPNGYVLNTSSQTITIKANETTTITMENKEQLANLTVVKEDAETGHQAQGAASLVGAEYALYDTSNKVVGQLTLKENSGQVKGELKGLKLGAYTLKETKAPTGYNVDPTKYTVNLTYAGQNETVSVKSMTVKDQVIKGGIELVKIGDKPLIGNPLENIRPNLEGVEFTITSKTTNKVTKVLTTDKEGKASTGKTLPFDTYVLTETKTPEGYLPIEPIEFTISEEDQKFFWVLEDKIIEARLHLLKVDAETGKAIPLRDTMFKIWDRWANEGEGAYVSMRVPNSLEVSDTFKTNEKGELVTSDSLPYGKDRYEIRELRAPEGYLLATEPVVFSVTEADAGGVIAITFKNIPQKGQVTLHKTGETGVSVTENQSEYGPYTSIQFEQKELANVAFKIRAAEDIVTPDGMVRLAKGDYVQKDGEDQVLVSDALGEATSDPNLYLGKYELVEIDAPSGFVQLKDPIPFEINYEGQLVELSSTAVTVENQLQAIHIYGHKKQEVVTDWQKGRPVIELENAHNGQVFGLYVGDQGLQVGETHLEPGTALAFSSVKDGEVAFEDIKLPNVDASFYLQEVDAGSDHVLDETKYVFRYSPKGNEREHTIHVFANGYAENKEILTKRVHSAIENKLARADVELLKVDDLGNKPLEGVVFELLRIDGKKETVIGSYTTSHEGKITVKELPTGHYRFKETQPLSWYEPAKEDLTFEVTPETNGQQIALKAVNQRKPMKLTTLLATIDGKKEADPTKDQILRDKVTIEGAEVGHTYFIQTAFVDPKTKKVLTTRESTYTAKQENEELFIDLLIPKYLMKDGQQGTATHSIYYDSKKAKLIGKEDDLRNKNQTVIFRSLKQLPKTGEKARYSLFFVGIVLLILVCFFLIRKLKNNGKKVVK